MNLNAHISIYNHDSLSTGALDSKQLKNKGCSFGKKQYIWGKITNFQILHWCGAVESQNSLVMSFCCYIPISEDLKKKNHLKYL